jgi:hypothetical protein
MNKVVHYINGSCANYINRKRNRIGHFSQGRYKGIFVDRDAYYLELSQCLVAAHLTKAWFGLPTRCAFRQPKMPAIDPWRETWQSILES